MVSTPLKSIRGRGLLGDLAERYRSALVDGRREAAAAVIGEGLEAGLDAPSLLVEVLAAGQRAVGELWHAGQMTIAEEHRATEVTREEIERVRLARRPPGALGLTAVVCAAPGEVHSLAPRLVATLLDCRGWTVEFLGEAPPGDELIGYVARRRPQLVALSVTLAANLPGVRVLGDALRGLDPRPRLLVGGSAAAGASPASLGVDAVAADAAAALELAAELAGAALTPDLPSYLAIVGRRIRERRRTAGLSQAELAERSGLTRPYLGAVERGRQNITLEAALKIGRALGLAMADLLAQDNP
jgi:methanogenic corrinoid protein MtbC1/DNA-binding XRE family transcriptional regulator